MSKTELISNQILEYYFRIKLINSGGTESEVGLWAIDRDTAILKATKHIPITSILDVSCPDKVKTRVFTFKN